jgi:CMP-N,N'-diacetyllegionaminic acid synthase
MFKFVALIPARGGSKGIKNKNLKKINGLSLTDLAIKIAKKSKIFSKIILSTDNKSILNSGKKYEIELHQRPKIISQDTSHISETIIEVKKKFNLNKNYYLIILEPTSPLRRISDIKNVYREILNKKYDSICTFTEASTIPYRSWTLNKKKMQPFLLNNKNIWVNRQKFTKFYQAVGNVIGINLNKFKRDILFGKKGYVLVEKSRAIDIDDIEDLKIVKKLI